MAKTGFQVEVLTPDGEAFNDEVVMVSTRTSIGSIGILANHQPLLATLDPTELRLYKSENDVVAFAQGEGFLQVQRDSRVLVLVDEVVETGDINTSEIQEKLKRAQGELDKAEEGSAAQREARRRVKRYETFLDLAGGGS